MLFMQDQTWPLADIEALHSSTNEMDFMERKGVEFDGIYIYI